MRLAFYTYSYTDRLSMPIGYCLERISKIGYSGIDVSGTHGPSADPQSFDKQRRRLTRTTAERWKLRIEAVITHAQLTDTLVDPKRKPLNLIGSIDLAVDLGADVVTFHMGGYHQDRSRSSLWNKVVEVIKAAADYGASKHVRLAVDGIWPKWIVDTPDALARLFEDVASVNFGVNFDPCYLTLMGVQPVPFLKRFRKRVEHGHLKDHKGKYPRWSHEIPGNGEINYGPIFRALRDLKLDVSVAVECFTDMKFDIACDQGYAAMTKAATGSFTR